MQELLPITTQPRRPALRYHGGKWALAPWIIGHFPEHRVYVEPFGGAASVLLRKPRARVEIYNDLDQDVVNYFRILRDSGTAQQLANSLALTPFSRSEFELAYEPSTDPMERARRLVVRSFFGFGSHSHNAANSNGFRWMAFKPYATEWANFPEVLEMLTQRLQGVLFECCHAFDLIARHDGPETLLFVDPPYPQATRDGHTKGYVHELTDHEHRQIAYLLHRTKAKVVLCGYPCSLYDEELYRDWRRVERQAYANGQRGRSERTEVLWLNF